LILCIRLLKGFGDFQAQLLDGRIGNGVLVLGIQVLEDFGGEFIFVFSFLGDIPFREGFRVAVALGAGDGEGDRGTAREDAPVVFIVDVVPIEVDTPTDVFGGEGGGVDVD